MGTVGFPWTKCQGTGAVQDASRFSGIIGPRDSVLDCGGPPPLFPAGKSYVTIGVNGFNAKAQGRKGRLNFLPRMDTD